MFWVYKCNSSNAPHQKASGDWATVFSKGRSTGWGSTEQTPQIAHAREGDVLLAYQTDRNELVGVALVEGWKTDRKGRELIVMPLVSIGVKVRPLKQSNPRIARIGAFRAGDIKTLYRISEPDALLLLKAARRVLKGSFVKNYS